MLAPFHQVANQVFSGLHDHVKLNVRKPQKHPSSSDVRCLKIDWFSTKLRCAKALTKAYSAIVQWLRGDERKDFSFNRNSARSVSWTIAEYISGSGKNVKASFLRNSAQYRTLWTASRQSAMLRNIVCIAVLPGAPLQCITKHCDNMLNQA